MNTHVDVCIIGGGAAGIMAALSVKKHHSDYSVVIIDRTFELGRKLLIAGAGRGNLTNIHLDDGPAVNFYGDENFIQTIFSQFGYKDIIHFFAELGVPTYEEKKTGLGKIFPIIDHAKTVRNIFLDALQERKIEIICNTAVSEVIEKKGTWEVMTTTGVCVANKIILAAGGQTYPSLGSDGSGYVIASHTGHTIISPVVSAVPIVSKNQLSHCLQGEKMIMRSTLYIEGKKIRSSVGDVMFTQYGFSGPAILDISHDISVRMNREKKQEVIVQLSFFPHISSEEVRTLMTERLRKHNALPVAHSLWGLVTEKTAGAICAISGLPKDGICNDMTKEQIDSLVQVLTAYTAEITGTRGWNEAEFTAGGVDTNDIHVSTLESKKRKGLYFAGEILNVDGRVGGFNLSWAWASGWVAGMLQ